MRLVAQCFKSCLYGPLESHSMIDVVIEEPRPQKSILAYNATVFGSHDAPGCVIRPIFWQQKDRFKETRLVIQSTGSNWRRVL